MLSPELLHHTHSLPPNTTKHHLAAPTCPLHHPTPQLNLQGLLDVLEASERGRGREAGLPALLDGCIAASVAAEFGRRAEEVYARLQTGGLEQLGACLIARELGYMPTV